MKFLLQEFNYKRRKAADRAASLVRIAAAAVALTLFPIPMEVSAIEESEISGREIEPISDTTPEETQPLDGSEQETSEETETDPPSDIAPTETESVEETEPETAKEEVIEPTSDAVPTETEFMEETEPETSEKKETDPTSSVVFQETESQGITETEASERGQEEIISGEQVSDSGIGVRNAVPSAVEIMVPIYNYDVVNIVAPAKYAVALNPYELAVKTGEDKVSTDQVVSRKYGILNKSSTDKIVSIALTVEDLNGGKIVFVDSSEEAWEADEDIYAVYLAAVPADDSGIWINGESADCDTTAMDLSDVEMNGAMESALPLKEGENTISFKLSKAVYRFEDGKELMLDDEDRGYEGSLKLSGLDPGEGGITAFTFTGAMNPKADWGKLLYGIRISAVYTYETAMGEEVIVEGTGAMLEI